MTSTPTRAISPAPSKPNPKSSSPVFVHGKVVGELDIDSHFLAAFGPDDRKLCEHAATTLGKFLESK